MAQPRQQGIDPGQGQEPQLQRPQAGNIGSDQSKLDSPATLKSECNSGKTESCVTLAKMYEEGKEVPQERARAAELYEKACRDGNADGCKGMMRTAK